jgi:DNA-binding NarL/FixJ family response regulator
VGTLLDAHTAGRRTAVLHDRHPLWLEGLGRLMTKLGIEVVGTSTMPETAVALVREHRPDLLVSDDTCFLAEARRTDPGLRAVVVSSSATTEEVDAAFAAGASAYVLKTAHPDDLITAVRQTFEHSIYTAPTLTVAALPTSVPDTGILTRREVEILRLVAEGRSNSQVARLLWVTEQTVKFHLSNVYRKLDVANRTEAGGWAHRHGLLGEPATA